MSIKSYDSINEKTPFSQEEHKSYLSYENNRVFIDPKGIIFTNTEANDYY